MPFTKQKKKKKKKNKQYNITITPILSINTLFSSIHLRLLLLTFFFFFFFNDTAPTEIYTLSLHDALPISAGCPRRRSRRPARRGRRRPRSEEHTSELQSPYDLVCRLLLEKKKTQNQHINQLNIKNKSSTNIHFIHIS